MVKTNSQLQALSRLLPEALGAQLEPVAEVGQKHAVGAGTEVPVAQAAGELRREVEREVGAVHDEVVVSQRLTLGKREFRHRGKVSGMPP